MRVCLSVTAPEHLRILLVNTDHRPAAIRQEASGRVVGAAVAAVRCVARVCMHCAAAFLAFSSACCSTSSAAAGANAVTIRMIVREEQARERIEGE